MANGGFGNTPSFQRFTLLSIILLILLIGPADGFSDDLNSRTISIKIAADSELRIVNKWEFKIRSLLRHCSHILENRVGLQLKVEEIEYWKIEEDCYSLKQIQNNMRAEVQPGESDIVLGIVSSKNKRAGPYGISSYFHGDIAVKYIPQKKAMECILLHELSHIFGAVDLHEPDSIMGIKKPGFKFDEFTSQIIQLNRNRTFHQNSFPLSKKQLNEAMRLFWQRAKLNLGESEIHRVLAFLHLEKQDYPSAISACKEALRSNPGQKEIHNTLGNIFLREGETDTAIREYQKVLQNLPNLPEIHFNLALAYSKKGMMDAALSGFEKAIELNPRYCRAHAHLAYLYFKAKKFDKAIKECGVALNINPGYAETLCTSAVSLIAKFDSLKSNAYPSVKFEESRIPPEGNSVYDKISEADALLEEAKIHCLKAIEINPKLPDAYNILGICHLFQNRVEKAEEEFLKAVELKPDYVLAHHNLGVLYTKKNVISKAAFHLKRIIDISLASDSTFQMLAQVFQSPQKCHLLVEAFESLPSLN